MVDRTLVKYLFPVLTLLQCAFIFSMSAAPAEVSADISGGLTYRAAELLIKNFEHLDMADRIAWIDLIDHIIRKTAHFAEYNLLGGLLAMDARLWIAKDKRTIFANGGISRDFFIPWLCGTLYACTDEWHQTFIEGRSGEVRDVILDSCGVLFGILLVFLLTRLYRRGRQRQRKSI